MKYLADSIKRKKLIYNIVAAHDSFGRLIFQYESFNNQSFFQNF